MWRKGNTCALLLGMKIRVATMENNIKLPQKIKNRTTIRSRNSASGYLSEENKKTNLKRYMHPRVYCSIIYSSQDVETA